MVRQKDGSQPLNGAIYVNVWKLAESLVEI